MRGVCLWRAAAPHEARAVPPGGEVMPMELLIEAMRLASAIARLVAAILRIPRANGAEGDDKEEGR